jgi:flagellar M-ring protein FliF
MRAFIDKLLTQIKDAFGRLDKKRKRSLFILASIVVIFAIVAVILLTQTTYVRLANFETVAQAEQIYARLQGLGIAARREGTLISVPDFAQEQAFAEVGDAIGTPRFDDSIMEGAAGFGISDQHQREIYARQLGDDIRVQILQSPRISNAFVIVRPGDTSPFRTATNLRAPSASVMLTTIDGMRLSQSEVEAIAGIIAASVQGITFENISIADSNLVQYRVGDASEDIEMVMSSRIAMQNMLEQYTRMSIEQVLARVFTRDNIEIMPSVTLNFDRVTEQIIEFNPPVAGELEGLIRSSSEIYEQQVARAGAMGIPGTDTNYMGLGEYPWGELGDDELYRRVVLERNFELNEMIRSIEYAEGTIEALTVSILVNSDAMEEDLSEEIIELVTMGVNIAPERISVVSMPFVEDPALLEQIAAWEAFEAAERTRELIRLIVTWGVILILGILLFLLGRSIIKALKTPPPVLADAAGVDIMIDGLDPELEAARLAEELEAQRIAEINLQARQPELDSIESFVEKDPATVAQLLRNWLTDE